MNWVSTCTYDDLTVRWTLPDPAEQFSNPYLAMGNNPVMYVDPDGEFVTWSAHAGGWSIGFNLTPIGVPIGAGFNLNTSSVGAYVEFGPRVGGTGFGSGATVSQSFDINTNTGKFSTTTAASVYGSIGYGSAGVGYSYAHMAHNDKINWNVYIGFGWGNDETGMGLSMSYGSGGFSIGAGGYYNSKAWESNPTYDPDLWNDFDIRNSNNCYSYARDEAEARPYGTKPQPGDRGGKQIRSADYEEVLNASLADGLKKPNFFNKLGFGKRGYYSIYLVVDNQGLRQDYHWYRQDKGGTWSHKRGLDFVQNYDGSGPGKQIHNVRRANHNYGFDLNYNQGGIILWKRR